MSLHSTTSTASSTTNGSGTTKPIVTNATSPSTVDLKREKAKIAFKCLQDCIKKISESEPEYADFDKIIRERDNVINQLEVIKLKLEKRDQEIDDLKRCRKLELEDVFAKTGELQQEKAKLTNKWKEEKKQMEKEHSTEKQKTKDELNISQSKIASLSVEKERAKDEARLTKTQLEAANQELAQWKYPLSTLRQLDVGELETKIGELFKKCVTSVYGYFFNDLPDDIFNVCTSRSLYSFGNDLTRYRIEPRRLGEWRSSTQDLFGVSPDNSQSAKLMRVAVAMNVLSSELAKTVFKPCYLPDSKDQSVTLQETLDKYFQDDRRTRSFMHTQFLSTHSREERRAVLHRWALTASANVLRKLSFMCQDGGTSFGARTRELFQCAADLWEEIQYVNGDIKIITSDNYHFPDWHWGSLEDFGHTYQPSEEELTLFPGFYVHDREIELYKGFALWRDQKHVETADSDWRSFQRARKPKLGQGSSAKFSTGRRHSISINGGPTPPLSPTSSPKELRPQTHLETKTN